MNMWFRGLGEAKFFAPDRNEDRQVVILPSNFTTILQCAIPKYMSVYTAWFSVTFITIVLLCIYE